LIGAAVTFAALFVPGVRAIETRRADRSPESPLPVLS
jgi:hypothetical protein